MEYHALESFLNVGVKPTSLNDTVSSFNVLILGNNIGKCHTMKYWVSQIVLEYHSYRVLLSLMNMSRRVVLPLFRDQNME